MCVPTVTTGLCIRAVMLLGEERSRVLDYSGRGTDVMMYGSPDLNLVLSGGSDTMALLRAVLGLRECTGRFNSLSY